MFGGRRLRKRDALFDAIPVEREVDDELAFHLEMQTRRFVGAGMSREAARAAALARFGDVERVRGECRTIGHDTEERMRRAELLQELKQDVTFAWRLLRRNPAFTAVAVLTIALGIGANTAIFSVVNGVLLRPLPYPNADRLLVVWNQPAAAKREFNAVSAPEFADYRDQARAFDGIAAINQQPVTLTGGCGAGGCEPERVSAYLVSPNVFDLLGVRPWRGRALAPDDGASTGEPVVVLSHALWMRRYGGDDAVIGRTLTVNGRPRTIVAVMPPGIRFPDAPISWLAERADLWLPRAWEESRAGSRGDQNLAVIARMAPGVTVARAQADLDAIAARFRAAFPDRYVQPGRWGITAVSLREQMEGDVRPALLVLSSAVGLVLLIACVNVANLLLARGAARRRELGVRVSLGAGRGRIARQLMTESAVLSLAGGALGVALAWWAVRTLAGLQAARVPFLDTVRIDGTVLTFSLALSVVTGLLFGLAPVVQQWRAGARDALTEGTRGSTAGRSHARVRTALVVSQMAMALVVLIGAGLLLRSFAKLSEVNPGFDASGVATFQLSLPRTKYDSAAKMVAFHQQLAERLAAIPGAQRASAVYPLPMSGEGWGASFEIVGRPTPSGEVEPHAEFATAMPGYFQTMGIPLRAGRDFTAQDVRGAPNAIVIDERLAERYWPNEDPLGKRVTIWGDGPEATVVGVVGHVHNSGPQAEGEPQLYLAFPQFPQSTIFSVVRTGGDPAALAPGVRDVVRALDPDLAVARLQPLTANVEQALARHRFNMFLLALFAGVALVLAAVGLYGVMAFLVTQRWQEIGIRLALGGRPVDVLRMVLGQGLVLALAGVAAGVVAAFLLSRLAATLLFGIAPTDPLTYVSVAALMALVALAASFVPARRATRADPVRVMRGA
jgi:predicted permease